MTQQITLIPLSSELHGTLLQEVYANTPGYWAMYNLLTAPAGQAERDLLEAEETPGRTMMGIVKPVERGQPGGRRRNDRAGRFSAALAGRRHRLPGHGDGCRAAPAPGDRKPGVASA